VLGSLNLPAFADGQGAIDSESLDACTRDAIRFLDDLIEVNAFPDPAIADATRLTRKVGLGLMGFADILLMRGLPYGGEQCLRLADELISRMKESAEAASRELASERGAFPAQIPSEPPRRNAALLAIAPTGTLRLIAGCSGGLEPFLQPVLRVREREGDPAHGDERWIDRWLSAWLDRHAREPAAVLDALESGCASSELPGLEAPAADLLRRGWEIPAEEQIAVQARFQAGVDGAVSKTVHLSPETSTSRIAELIHLAREAGCKGVAFYRRGLDSPPPEVALSTWCEGTCPSAEGDRLGVGQPGRARPAV
jgi:ribonucleoside-diphosphate reductase alpha chain